MSEVSSAGEAGHAPALDDRVIVRGQRRRRLAVSGGYAAAMYAARIALMLKSILLAWLLGPTAFGLVAVFLTLVGYSIYLDFGLLHAVYREIPMLRGAGRHRRALRVADVAYGGIIALSAAFATLLLIVAGLEAAGALPGPWWFTLALAGAVAMQQIAYLPYNVALADGDFGLLAAGISAAAVVDLGASVGAAFAWGSKGAIAVSSAGFLVQYAVLLGWLRPRPVPRWAPREALRLAAIGIPIALIWFGNTNFVALDKLVALVGLGQTSVGLYTLASAVSSLAMVGPVAIAVQFGPGILRKLGRAQESREAGRTAAVALDVSGLTAAPIVAASIVVLPAVTYALLPKYAESIRSAQILAAGGALLATSIPLVSYSIGRGRQWAVVRLYLASAAFNIALDAVLLVLGFGIEGIAIGSLGSYLLFTLAIRVLGAGIGAARLGRLLVGLLPIAWATAVGAAASAVLYEQGLEQRLVPTAIAAVAAVAAVAPLILAYVRAFRTRQIRAGLRSDT